MKKYLMVTAFGLLLGSSSMVAKKHNLKDYSLEDQLVTAYLTFQDPEDAPAMIKKYMERLQNSEFEIVEEDYKELLRQICKRLLRNVRIDI